MAHDIGSDNISYFEYKAINELMHAHIDEFGKNFRAMIAVGPLVTGEATFDIELIEVIDKWAGPASLSFSSTPGLPLRGTLLLHFLSSAAFESISSNEQPLLNGLLREGYAIIYEVPTGYVRRTLTQSLTPGIDSIGSDSRSVDRSSDPRKPLLR